MKRIGALALIAVFTALVTGCGDDGGSADDVDPRERSAAEAWADDFCGALVDWQEAIGRLVGANEPETRQELRSFFSGAVVAYDELLVALDDAGVPDVEGADEVAATYVVGMTRARDLAAEALAEVEALGGDFDDEARTAVLDAYGEGLADVEATFARAGDEFEGSALEGAFAANADCATVS